MKLHLPKQLFTALLTAITLAASPVAKGAVDFNELGIVREDNCYAHDYTFSFILNEDAFNGVTADNEGNSTIVLAGYWSSNSNNPDSNAIVLIRNSAGDITLKIGRGKVGQYADLGAGSTFTFHNETTSYRTLDTNLEIGAVYTLYVAGGDQKMEPTLYSIAAGSTSADVASYKGNMNGNDDLDSVFNHEVATLVSKNVTDTTSGTATLEKTNTLVWAGKAAEDSTSATWGTWNNISGTSNGATADATSDLIFDATSTVAKEVNITDSVTAGSIALYDDYTFNATEATSLTVTNGITIAQGKSLTLQGSAITLTGAFSINGTLNIGGTLALTSSDQLGTLGAPTVKSGGVLDLTGCDSCVTNNGSNGGVNDEFSTINDSSVKTEDGGYIRVAFNHTSDKELKLGASIELKKNIEAQGALVVHGNGNSHAITIGEGVSLKATSVTGDNGLRGLEAINKAIISITGGSVEASRIVLGHDSSAGDFWGKLEMTTGSLKSGAIHLRENHSNVVSITGGNVEFTEANVLVRVDANNPNKKTLITIGGTGTDSVTLKANQVAWTLDGTGLDTVPTIGNVTIDAENAYGITLNKINLTGAIINNSSLTIGSATVAAGSTVSISGSGTTNLTGTITNNGSLTLNGSIELLGELKTNFAARSEAGESYVMADGSVSLVNNGFLKLDGGSYWLTTGNGSVTMDGITEGETTLKHGQDTYKLYIDNGDEGEGNTGNYYIGVESNIGTVFYVSTGVATVDKDVFERATAYHLLGGKMQIDTGVTLNSSSISYTEGSSIALEDGAALKLDSTSLTASSLLSDSGFLSTIRDEDEKTEIGKVIITQATTLNDGFEATFDGAVECDGVKLTAGTAPGNSVDLSSISNFILNNGAEIYYHANPTKDLDIQKITVEAGTGSLKLQDSDGAAFDVGSVEIASGATFKFWSNWHDSDLNIGAVSGAGKFRAESSDNSIQSGKVNIASLDGFTGSLEFEKDTQYALTVVINTGSSAVDFASLETINSNGSVDLTFNVQADTSVASLTAAGGTVNISEGKTLTLGGGTADAPVTHSIGTLTGSSDASLHLAEHAVLKKVSTVTGSVTLTGSGMYDLGSLGSGSENPSITNVVTMGNGSTDAEKWKGTVKISGGSNAPGNNNSSVRNIDFNNLGQAGSTVEIGSDGVYGYLQSGNNTYAANIKFAGDFYIQNSHTSNSPTATFSGNIVAGNEGGRIVVSRTNTGTNKYKFTGDVSKWNTSFTQDTTGTGVISEVIFAESANSINAAILNENQGTLNLEINTTQDATLSKNVEVSKIVVKNTAKLTGETNSITAGNATILRQNASLSNVTVQGSSIAAAVNTNGAKGSISNADVQIAQLAADATFTIADMTLTNTTITAATTDTKVSLNNVSVAAGSAATLAKGAFAMQNQAIVGMGGSKLEFTTSSYSGLTLGADASLTVDLGDLSCLTPMEYGQRYDLTITLSGFSMGDYEGDYAGSALQFAADSWLGELLAQGNNANVHISISQMEEGAAAAGGGGGATGVSYSTGNVGTIITITGLNVPEPATSTLSLLALAGLCARRRRKM